MSETVDNIIIAFDESNNTNTDSILKIIPTTTKGMLISYISVIFMALVSIYLGSFRSVKLHLHMKMKKEIPELLTERHAMMLPIILSGFIFIIFILLEVLSMKLINGLLTSCFYIYGVQALNNLLRNQIISVLPKNLPKTQFKFKFYWINVKFTLHEAICFMSCATLGSLYLFTKHWIVQNIFGLVLVIKHIEILHLNKFKIGCIILCGLFIYDIFWVFGTNVMTTVVKSFDAPIKVVFPSDSLGNGFLGANTFLILGLGDIIVPGSFIAFLLRFDQSLKRKTNLYFNVTLLAYFVGLLTASLIMHTYKAGQPALLYLVPACLITPILVALISGDLKALFSYKDYNMELEESS